jgi:hypothetical protein
MIDLLVTSLFNLYGPGSVVSPTDTKVYMGGMPTTSDKHDQIYGVFCTTTSCGPVELVIPNTKYNHINDPTVVKKPAWGQFPTYYMMYMTCTMSYLGDGKPYTDDVCYAVSYDGHVWSEPQLLIRDAAYPTAILQGDEVLIWYNYKFAGGEIKGSNLGKTGIEYSPYTSFGMVYDHAVVTDRLSNVDVSVFDGKYNMLAEATRPDSTSHIVEFVSQDFKHWEVTNQDVIPLQPDYVYNGTPHYLTQNLIMYGATKQRDSMGFNVRVLER